MHPMAKFGDPSFNPTKVIVQTSPFLADFDFLTQMTLKVKVKFHHIQSHLRSTYEVHNAQIWWHFESYWADKHVFLPILTPNDLEGQGQIPPYTIPSEIYLLCTYCLHLVTLASILQKFNAWTSPFFLFWWFWPFWPQMTLKVKVKSFHVQSQARSS